MTRARFLLNNTVIEPPVEWQAIQILATYDNDSVEANIDIENFRFVNESAKIILDHIASGNIFQGMPFKIELEGRAGAISVFDGFLDTARGLRVINPSDVSCAITKLDSLTDLNRKIEGITYRLLYDRGIITNADFIPMQYLVEKENNAADIGVLLLAVYMLTQTLNTEVRSIATEAALLIADATGGATGPAAAIILAAALLLIRAAFAVAMIVSLVRLIDELFQYIYPREQTDYGMTFRTALSRVFGYLGYSFFSPIPEMDWLYLPSSSEEKEDEKLGIPNPQDYGYRAVEMVDLCKSMFNAKIRIDSVSKTVELRSLNDPFWRSQSQWVKPDVLREEVVYNTDKVISSRIVSFTLDSSDYFTLDRFKGTAYEIGTRLITEPTNRDLIGINGLEEIRFPLALGARKNGLTDIERLLDGVIKAVNRLLKAFLAPNVKNKVANRQGLLIKGQKQHIIPKVIIRGNDGRIPANHLDTLSAKALYDKYINEKSLVANNFASQAETVTDEPNPFTMADFLAIQNNKYFNLADGREAEMKAIKWAFDSDTALLTYDVRQPYATGLTEITVEPT